jgi:hypothetical protein
MRAGLPPRRKVSDGLVADGGQLERAVPPDAIDVEAEIGHLVCEGRMIDSASRHLPVAQDGGMQRSHRAIGARRHVQDDSMGVKVRIPEDPTIGMLRRAAFAVLEQRSRQRDPFDACAIFAAACVYGFPLDRGQRGADGALLAASRFRRRSSSAKAHASDTERGAEDVRSKAGTRRSALPPELVMSDCPFSPSPW